MHSKGKINELFMIYTVLVLLNCHSTEIHILHRVVIHEERDLSVVIGFVILQSRLLIRC